MLQSHRSRQRHLELAQPDTTLSASQHMRLQLTTEHVNARCSRRRGSKFLTESSFPKTDLHQNRIQEPQRSLYHPQAAPTAGSTAVSTAMSTVAPSTGSTAASYAACPPPRTPEGGVSYPAVRAAPMLEQDTGEETVMEVQARQISGWDKLDTNAQKRGEKHSKPWTTSDQAMAELARLTADAPVSAADTSAGRRRRRSFSGI